MQAPIRIGTRDSRLAVWQATRVRQLLHESGYTAEIVYIKSDGDIDLQTPLYAMGVQGIFTRSLDIALLNNQIDIAVHSMKDVPVQLPKKIIQAAVLQRASYKDLLVTNGDLSFLHYSDGQATIATSSIRRRAQWLRRYPNHNMENLRGNMQTRLDKLRASKWNGAIFAAAGLERIGLRPAEAIELDWMLPAPAQGAIMVVCRQDDDYAATACATFNDSNTELCTRIERDFLKGLLGGCSTPISALAEVKNNMVQFSGNVISPDGRDMLDIVRLSEIETASSLGRLAAETLLASGAANLIQTTSHAK